MNTTRKTKIKIFNPATVSLVLAISAMINGTLAKAECTEIASDLREPLATLLTAQGNLLVSETGTPDTQSGRISIFDSSGNRRTLLDGLPSGIADAGDPSGPAGLFLRGRTLYVLIGVGDVGIAGPRPGTTRENPNGPSSPLFSSILSIKFSPAVERLTNGFTLTMAQQQALANGGTLHLSNGGQDKIEIKLVADFPNFVPMPLPDVPDNIAVSNPYSLTLLGKMLYVTDGGRNHVWEVDLRTGSFSILTSFPDIPNPLFPNVGGPNLQAVPTGITAANGQLFVTLLRGAPFPTGASTVEQVDPITGDDTTFISNLTSAIDILPFRRGNETRFTVLEFSNQGPFFSGPGTVLRFDGPNGPPVTVADCLSQPTSMANDRQNHIFYVTEGDGHLIAVPY